MVYLKKIQIIMVHIDEIVLTFNEDVKDFEAGDFRLFTGTTDINQPAISAAYGKKTDDLTKEDKRKLFLKLTSLEVRFTWT